MDSKATLDLLRSKGLDVKSLQESGVSIEVIDLFSGKDPEEAVRKNRIKLLLSNFKQCIQDPTLFSIPYEHNTDKYAHLVVTSEENDELMSKIVATAAFPRFYFGEYPKQINFFKLMKELGVLADSKAPIRLIDEMMTVGGYPRHARNQSELQTKEDCLFFMQFAVPLKRSADKWNYAWSMRMLRAAINILGWPKLPEYAEAKTLKANSSFINSLFNMLPLREYNTCKQMVNAAAFYFEYLIEECKTHDENTELNRLNACLLFLAFISSTFTCTFSIWAFYVRNWPQLDERTVIGKLGNSKEMLEARTKGFDFGEVDRVLFEVAADCGLKFIDEEIDEQLDRLLEAKKKFALLDKVDLRSYFGLDETAKKTLISDFKAITENLSSAYSHLADIEKSGEVNNLLTQTMENLKAKHANIKLQIEYVESLQLDPSRGEELLTEIRGPIELRVTDESLGKSDAQSERLFLEHFSKALESDKRLSELTATLAAAKDVAHKQDIIVEMVDCSDSLALSVMRVESWIDTLVVSANEYVLIAEKYVLKSEDPKEVSTEKTDELQLVLLENKDLLLEIADLKNKLSKKHETQESIVVAKYTDATLNALTDEPTLCDVVTIIKEMFPATRFLDMSNLESNTYRHPRKLLKMLVRLCGPYFQAITSGIPDSEAMDILGNKYKANESEVVMTNKVLSAMRVFNVEGKPQTFIQHLTLGTRRSEDATIQVHFKIIDGVLWIARIGEHLPVKGN
jgi:hypothetical protein